MAIASRIDSFVVPTLTQQSIYDGIKQAFNNAGYLTPFDDYISGTDRVLIYAVVLNSSRVFGTSYIRIRLTSTLVINQQIYSTWNTSTKANTGGSTEIVYTAFNTTTQINFTALNASSEFRLIIASQGSNVIVLGFVSPSNIPNWWNLDAWNYCFIPANNTFSLFRTTTFNPYANTENDTTLNNVRMSIANTQTNRRDLLPGIIFFTQANQGISGRTSDDLAMLSGSGTTRFDTIQIPGDTRQYLLLNPASGGLVVRIA